MSEISKLDNDLVIKKIDHETVNVQINDNEMLMAVVGQFDQNLKNLSKLTDTNIFFKIQLLVKGRLKILVYSVRH